MRIAHAIALPPFAEAIDGGSKGIAVDILRAAAAHAGFAVTFVPVPFEVMQTALEDGRADAALPVAITNERRERLDFSDVLLMTGGALFVRAPEPTPDSLDALTGKTIATPRTGPLANYIARRAPEVTVMETDSYETSLDLLVSGKADAAALNDKAGALLAARLHPGKVTMPRGLFLELPFAVAVLKGTNADTLVRLNKGLAGIRANGTQARIIAKWLDPAGSGWGQSTS